MRRYWNDAAKVKRLADAMEKLGVGSLLVGIFQDSIAGYILGAVFLAISLVFTKGK